MSNPKDVYVADFETTTKENDCRVWGYGYADVENPDVVIIGHTLDEFIQRISERDRIVYFHNLKFDGTFILYWLLTNGYEHTESRGRLAGEFSSLISDTGKMYSITVCFKNGKTIEFRDSVKKLPMSLARVAESFNIDKLKGEIDYDKERPVGYIMTADEEDYIYNDVYILAKAIKQVHVDNNMRRLTVGSDSLAEYKRQADVDFRQTFPQLSYGMDAEIRQAYRGGYTYVSERFKGRRLGSGVVLDVNSLYPHIMKERLIPYGEPDAFLGEFEPTPTRPLAIFSMTFTAKLKPDHIPIIQIKGSSMFVPTEYVEEISEPTTLWVTNVDWELYNEHYDVNIISYNGGYSFMAAKGLFDSYIDKWSRVKEHSSGGIREIAKLHLNSLYGKLATRCDVQSKIPYLKDGVVKYRLAEAERREALYTPAGVFITSWARDLTIRAAQQNYDSFAYCDTDSLHLMRDTVPDSIDVHKTRMGAWKLEYQFSESYYIRSKAYLERKINGEWHNAIAGVPTHVSAKLTIGDIQNGLVLHGKLVPKNVPGGVILQDSPYELKL